jgi:hypothetical protein
VRRPGGKHRQPSRRRLRAVAVGLGSIVKAGSAAVLIVAGPVVVWEGESNRHEHHEKKRCLKPSAHAYLSQEIGKEKAGTGRWKTAGKSVERRQKSWPGATLGALDPDCRIAFHYCK